MNKLYFGDNLEILREIDDESVDLICTDPPFNSGRDYNAFIDDSLAQKKAFADTWTWDTAAQDARADTKGQCVLTLHSWDPGSLKCTGSLHPPVVSICTAIRLQAII